MTVLTRKTGLLRKIKKQKHVGSKRRFYSQSFLANFNSSARLRCSWEDTMSNLKTSKINITYKSNGIKTCKG